jgi:hypothetical protein
MEHLEEERQKQISSEQNLRKTKPFFKRHQGDRGRRKGAHSAFQPDRPAQICAISPTLACSLDAKRTRLCGVFRPNRDGTRLAPVLCGMDWEPFIDAGKQFCR